MPTITPSAALKQIATGDLAPVYLVLGDDDVEQAEMAHAFEQVIDEGLRAFNVDRFHGGESKLSDVIEAARTLPMMAPRRLVIVLRVERCLTPKRQSQSTEDDLAAFETYLEDPQPHSCLVLVAGSLDKRLRTTARLLKMAVVVMCGVIESSADAERWARRRVEADGLKIAPEAVRLLAARSDLNLTRLRGDVERLLLFVAGQPSVGVADVLEIVGSATAHDDWAVARAIESGRPAQALKELSLVLESGAAPFMVLGQLAWVVRTKLSSDRLQGSMEALLQTDLDLKTSAGDHRVLLERLVMNLCGVRLVAPHGLRRP
jgi:DNA polymerase-3 subunit delta